MTPPAPPAGCTAWPELGSTIRLETSTASILEPITERRVSSSLVFHRASGCAWRNHAIPLSARISPYFWIARRMVCMFCGYPVISKFAFRRKRCPMGGKAVELFEDAKCRPGHTYARCVTGAVKRKAWLICPEATSSYRSSPGMIGSPAASADVHPSGRNVLALRSHLAALSTFQLPSGCKDEAYVSYNTQLSLSTTMTCASPPGSPPALGGIGYGPGSLSVG